MTFKELMMHFEFDITKTSQEIGASRQSIHRWKNNNRIPFEAQLKIQIATNGALKASDWFDEKGVSGL